MKHVIFLLCALLWGFTGFATTNAIQKSFSEPVVHVEKGAGAHSPMQIFLGVIGKGRTSGTCKQFIADIKRCLEYDGKFAVSVKVLKNAPTKKSTIQKLFQQEYDCALFICFEEQEQPIEWRLYDTLSGAMVQGKRQQHRSGGVCSDAYALASSIMYELTAEETPFLTQLAYRTRDFKKQTCSLHVTHFDGSHGHVLLGSHRILVAPDWSTDTEYPSLFFSEFTPSNVRLMACDMQGRKKPVLDLDGTTVGISYAPWSDEVVYCRSGDLWHYQYDVKRRKGVHRLIIREAAPCASPTLLRSGDILYCCRGTIKRYHAATKERSILTKGYCVGPAYCPQSGKMIYSKRVHGCMQLFLLDLSTGQHKQLTFESNKAGDKDYRSDKTDACWSPCGTFCAFCWEQGQISRIAILNAITREYRFITPENMHCSYPAWSPRFDRLPAIG